MPADPLRLRWPVAGAVLIVDDEEIVRRTCAAQLQQIGCTCYTAGSYSEALSLIQREGCINTIVADHGVHGDDTEAFVLEVRARRPGAIVVGSSGTDCRAELARFGVARFLRKPWQLTKLVELVSGRMEECASCGISIPLRRPFPGEVGEHWVCAYCGGRYLAVIDQDSPPDVRRNVCRPEPE